MDGDGAPSEYSGKLADLFELAGMSAFVAGGYGDIGRAIAWGLALKGARVAIGGRDGAKAGKLASTLQAAGHAAIGVNFDGTAVAEIGDAVDHVVDALGGLDILVNCLGINIKQPLAEVTEAAFDEVYRVNLKSAMFLGQAAARRQIECGRGGRQVHMLSVSAARGFFGRGYSAYCATKGALVMLVRQHALELAPHRILVNGVAPTYVVSNMIREALADTAARNELTASIPLGRLAEPADIVGPTLFLASPASGFVTGQVLYVDGGVTANR